MIKKFFLGAVVMTMLVIGSNPADYDPFHDNPDDTYHVLAAKMPFPMPQFVPPQPAPNAEACKDVWDKGIPCPSDGKFYGYWGELQPEYCDNNHFMPDGKTLKPDADKCTCNIAMMTDPDKCPMMDGKPVEQIVDGQTCQVYCREKDHCHCVKVCDAYVPDAAPTPKPAPKAQPKRGKK